MQPLGARKHFEKKPMDRVNRKRPRKVETASPAMLALEDGTAFWGRSVGHPGEVMSFGETFPVAFAKAQIAAGNPIPIAGTVFVSLADTDKREGTTLVAQLHEWGFNITATRGTARVLQAMDIPAAIVPKVGEGRPDVVDLIAQGHVDLVVNTQSADQQRKRSSAPPLPITAEQRGHPLPVEGQHTVGHRIRAAALEHHIPFVTNLVTFRATVAAMRTLRSRQLPVHSLGNLVVHSLGI